LWFFSFLLELIYNYIYLTPFILFIFVLLLSPLFNYYWLIVWSIWLTMNTKNSCIPANYNVEKSLPWPLLCLGLWFNKFAFQKKKHN
jgi:hypothetical protein